MSDAAPHECPECGSPAYLGFCTPARCTNVNCQFYCEKIWEEHTAEISSTHKELNPFSSTYKGSSKAFKRYLYALGLEEEHVLRSRDGSVNKLFGVAEPTRLIRHSRRPEDDFEDRPEDDFEDDTEPTGWSLIKYLRYGDESPEHETESAEEIR